ncbi:hypothetical protein M0804_007622 [Polistes exclamans]|nr:hypothetical protein M0804_007622 [Polistes exclamans]
MRLPLNIDSPLPEIYSNELLVIPEIIQIPNIPIIEHYYRPWTIKEECLEYEKYCSFDFVTSVLERIKGILSGPYYFDLTIRCLYFITRMDPRTLVKKNRQFPHIGTYVNVTTGIFADMLKSITTCLDCITCKTKTTYVVCNCSKIVLSRLNYLLHLINKIPANKLYYYGVYTRATFEKWHALKWV